MMIGPTLAEAVAEHVRPGDTVALEGFSHLIPGAVAHEMIRQELTDLTLVRLTPDVIYDQLIGAGCASRLVFSWAGNPGVGSLHRFRDAVERGWPRPLQLEEYDHAELTNAYVAGASGLSFAVMRGPMGAGNRPWVATVQSPFDDQTCKAVKAVRPTVTAVHAQVADFAGNVMFWGVLGVQREAIYGADRVIVTVEQVVDHLPERSGSVVVPSWVVDAVVEVPNGAHPSYSLGFTERDSEFYLAWDAISRDRTEFEAWIDRCIRATTDHEGYLRAIGALPPHSAPANTVFTQTLQGVADGD